MSNRLNHEYISQYEPLWDAWYIETLIGEGAFGKVYRLRREEFGRSYFSALKVIPSFKAFVMFKNDICHVKK